jgi:hypothetical protein
MRIQFYVIGVIRRWERGAQRRIAPVGSHYFPCSYVSSGHGRAADAVGCRNGTTSRAPLRQRSVSHYSFLIPLPSLTLPYDSKTINFGNVDHEIPPRGSMWESKMNYSLSLVRPSQSFCRASPISVLCQRFLATDTVLGMLRIESTYLLRFEFICSDGWVRWYQP